MTMTIGDHDARCNALFRKLDVLKASGADKVKGGEYDAVLRELQTATRERLGACGLRQATL
jgi:hypothetical protein